MTPTMSENTGSVDDPRLAAEQTNSRRMLHRVSA
jgi:hypothetical protein